MHAALIGFGLGFFVALQLGPISLFMIRSTLRGGLWIGLSIGAGIALIDALYATLGVAGAAPLVSIGPVRVVLGLVGGAVLVVLACARCTAPSACGAAERPSSRCRAGGGRSRPP